jgi:hypothetical protein
MASKNKSQKNTGQSLVGIKRETKDGVIAVGLFLLTVLSMLASFNKAGIVGQYLFNYLSKLVGVGYYLIPIASFILGISFIKNFEDRRFPAHRLIGTILFFFAGLGIIDIVFANGGIIGKYISKPIMALFDFYAGITILCALLIVSVLIIFESKLTFRPILSISLFLRKIVFGLFSLLFGKKNKLKEEIEDGWNFRESLLRKRNLSNQGQHYGQTCRWRRSSFNNFRPRCFLGMEV